MSLIYRLTLLALIALPACRDIAKVPEATLDSRPTTNDRAKTPPLDAAVALDRWRHAEDVKSLATAQLAKDPSQALLAKIDQAHYDAVRQGLKELSFSLSLTTKGLANNTETEAKGSWRGGEIELELTKVSREGQAVPKNTKEGEQIWGFAKDLTLRLLAGLGHGYLRPRIDEFIPFKGTVKRKGKTTEIIYQNPDKGTTTFQLGEGPRIERLSMASADGVERAMSYTYQIEGDYNMVKEALLNATVSREARYPKRIKVQIRQTNGTRYQFKHVKVGNYYLPSTLHRTTPRLTKAPTAHEYGEETLLQLKYHSAR